jgi:hypothetical protein
MAAIAKLAQWLGKRGASSLGFSGHSSIEVPHRFLEGMARIPVGVDSAQVANATQQACYLEGQAKLSGELAAALRRQMTSTTQILATQVDHQLAAASTSEKVAGIQAKFAVGMVSHQHAMALNAAAANGTLSAYDEALGKLKGIL